MTFRPHARVGSGRPRFLLLVVLLLMPAVIFGVTDRYSLTLVLRVPRTYSNEDSLGYRRYQTQTLKGDLVVSFGESGEQPVVAISNLVNMTHKIGGARIAYDCAAYDARWNLIGNNARDKFETPSVVFSLDALPSYAIEVGEDNTLLLTLAGTGYTMPIKGSRIIRRLTGYAAGQIGCGCAAYGHVSPTRVADTNGASDTVDDIASVYGSFTANWKRRD